MVRYYFHVRRDETVFEDHVGKLLPGLTEAWEWAMEDALALVQDDSLDGSRHSYWIEVCDTERRAVVTLPISRFTMQ